MRTAKGFQAACLAPALALLGSACTGLQRDTGADGVRGGTLRVLTAEPDITLDTAVFSQPTIARAYTRTL